MKKIILTMLVIALITACSKENDGNPVSLMPEFHVFFDLKKSDETPFEEGEINYKMGYFNYDDEWVYDETWYVMTKKELHGEEYFFEMFPMGYGEQTPQEGDKWLNKREYILKYLDSEITDIIMVKDSADYPYHRIDIFLNGELYNTYNSYEMWLIALSKDEF